MAQVLYPLHPKETLTLFAEQFVFLQFLKNKSEVSQVVLQVLVVYNNIIKEANTCFLKKALKTKFIRP